MISLPLGMFYRLLGFGPCILITSGEGEKANVAPIAWTTPLCDEPPMAGIAVARTHETARLIRKHRAFVINVPPASFIPKLLVCGSVSGRKTDKFKRTGLLRLSGIKVKTPHIQGVVAFIECKLKSIFRFPGVDFFIGRVVHAAVDARVYRKGVILPKAKTFHHMGGGTFALTGRHIR
jgi:flavin reductase (DIM6/NTAB) family NADH-FMN oxidoreductase RutF